LIRRSRILFLLLVLALALVVARGWRQGAAVRALTAEIRNVYNLPPNDHKLPISSIAEVIPDGLSPSQVVRRLQLLRKHVVTERWVAGKRVDNSPFQAHVIGLKLVSGGRFEVAFVYRRGVLKDIDTPEYLGEITELPNDSPHAWVRTGDT
jgi:hypothetical protein